jgi:hypothetical protein
MSAEISELFKANIGSYIKKYSRNICENRIIVEKGKAEAAQPRMVVNNSKNINKNTWKELKNTFGINESSFKKLNIIPLMSPLMCHENSKFLARLNSNIMPILGFNITAGSDGKFLALELHSVVQYKGEYYDMTRDFFDESFKYFMPILNYIGDYMIPAISFHTMEEFGFSGGYIYNKKHHVDGSRVYKCPTNQRFDNLKNKYNALIKEITETITL